MVLSLITVPIIFQNPYHIFAWIWWIQLFALLFRQGRSRVNRFGCVSWSHYAIGLILETTNVIASMPPGHCLGALEMPVEIYNFLIGCPLQRRKCLGVLFLSKMKHTGPTAFIQTRERCVWNQFNLSLLYLAEPGGKEGLNVTLE